MKNALVETEKKGLFVDVVFIIDFFLWWWFMFSSPGGSCQYLAYFNGVDISAVTIDTNFVSLLFNSLAPGRCGSKFKNMIITLIDRIVAWALTIKLQWGECNGTSFIIGSGNGLVPSVRTHYLNECWPSSVLLYGPTRQQWVQNTVLTALYDVVQFHYSDVTWASYCFKSQQLDCLWNSLFKITKETEFCFTGICEGNPLVTSGFPSQKTSNANSISMSWRHHVLSELLVTLPSFWNPSSFAICWVFHLTILSDHCINTICPNSSKPVWGHSINCLPSLCTQLDSIGA